ncbi:TrkH family potassium uptake protein [Mesomycoplasma molare]|uniref:Cation transporter n=1 Tax=Mesomycoplasma molare TaxID=171288 RepID=A0ABY5TVB1_9BACT|nr:potassium transporter TrkG [Mesomycoplasma molare]UWD34582.1 cation transporter [Mesomycoplasma molare]
MKKNNNWKFLRRKRKFNKFKLKNVYISIVHFVSRFNRKIGKIRYLFLTYIFITIIGSLLLYWDISQVNPGDISYIDALFTSASAFSDTGLVVKNTYEQWTIFGQMIIAILILIGGIGIFAIKVYILNYIFGVKLGIFARDVLLLERSSHNIGDIRRVIIVSITIMFSILIVSSFILFFLFYYSEGNFIPNNNINNPKYDFNLSLRFAIFHSITALNNAGFDMIGKNSLAPYYGNYFLQIWLLFLFMLGGIGYPVIYDIYRFITSFFTSKRRSKYRFTLFSKISLVTYFSVAIVGLALLLTFELTSKDQRTFWNLSFSDPLYWGNGINIGYSYGSNFDKIFALFFTSFSTRSAGFATFDLYNLSDPSLIILSVLMFIGAAPSSTGGGIRSTTLAIILLNLISRMRGKNSTHLFKRKIKDETVNQSSIVLIISFILTFLAVLVLTTSFSTFGGKIAWDGATELNKGLGRTYGITNVLFEVTSAFGTTGLSTGITSSLNTLSKISLIFIMFIGQLGISSTILIWGSHNHKFTKFEYIEEDVTIG